MIALKKLYGDELLRLALVLSLLKNPSDHLEAETHQLMAGLHISNGTDWAYDNEPRTLIRPRYVHPKSLDNILINYERELFEELNSLGRYSNSYLNNERSWISNSPVLHTYVVNNVTTEPVASPPTEQPVDSEVVNDSVSGDDNVAQEVKVEDTEDTIVEAVVTLSPSFFENRTETDIFAEIASRTFDVNEFLVNPADMIKKESDVTVKEEPMDLYDDNAVDNFVPYINEKSDNFLDESPSVFDQNMADLKEYADFLDDVTDLKTNFEYLDNKQEDLEQYLLENTPLDSEVYNLAPLFDEELVLDVKRERASTSFTSASSSGVSEMENMSVGSEVDIKMEPDEGHHSGDELTQEDMDLIEVLWKQDVDMGFCLDAPVVPPVSKTDGVLGEKKSTNSQKFDDEDEKQKEGIEKVKQSLLEDEVKEDDPWAGLSYTVDTETGEYVLQGELPSALVSSEDSRFDLLEEALQLVGVDEAKDEPPVEVASDTMLHPAMARHHMPHHHPLAHYHNQRATSEQRWQDLASLLTIPPPPDQYAHYQHHAHSHGAAGYAPNYGPIAAPPVPDKHPDSYGASAQMDGAYKMEAAHHPQQHEAMYYQNPPAEMGVTNSDGFLQSILNDEDLQLMDMAMNEGMYTMRILDGGAAHHHHQPHHNHTHVMMTERDSLSDSAVSSMGSERVPSLSDSEWCDGSDSAQEFHSSKFRPYDASYGRDRAQPQKKHQMFGKRCFQEQPTPVEPLVARNHGVVKYECTEPNVYAPDNMHLHNVAEFGRAPPMLHPAMDNAHSLLQPPLSNGLSTPGRISAERIRHNHTYSAVLAPDRRRTVDKRERRLTEGSMSDAGSTTSSGQHMSRDEKRAKALDPRPPYIRQNRKITEQLRSIPLEVHDIINLPMDEFNERLSKHDLSEAQLSLIRDIRRRGKNKVAAQNCRKRKLDQISCLADEVRSVRDRRQRVQRDHAALAADAQRLKDKFAALYRHVFQSLRDPEGRPLSSAQFSLQQAADGSVVLVPKMGHHSDQSMNRTSDDDLDRKAKSYEQ